jgi:predicted site-specific integrase-resolvase
MVYVKGKEASRILGVTGSTLRRWADTKKIKSIRSEGGVRLYDTGDYIANKTNEDELIKTKKKYIYCRVSSHKQKGDLDRQIKYLKDKYPEHEVIHDIASGINFNRHGFKKILADTFEGLVQEVVVAHKDRLCRIAWQHFAWLFEYYRVNLIIEDKQEYNPETEFSDDLLSIVHVFSSRHYGIRRKYTTKSGKTEETQVVANE